MAARLLYRMHSFPLAVHGNTVTDESVKPILFCFSCQVGSVWGSHYFKGNKEKKKSVWHLYSPGWFWLFDGAYNYTCSHGLQPWVWCLTTPQAYSRTPALCSITLEFILLGFSASESWQARENIKQQYFCADCIHFLPSVVRTKISPTSERLPSGNWGRLTQPKGARTYT